MEYVKKKRNKKWKKKKRLRQKRLREQIKIEVRSFRHRKIFPNRIDKFAGRTSRMDVMDVKADAFWKNYTVAQEWQRRHSITWWKSRCMALEHENEILREKIRTLALNCSHNYVDSEKDNFKETTNSNTQRTEVEYDSDYEELEFNMTKEMLEFLEKSERHKRKMQAKEKSEKIKCDEARREEISGIIGGAAEAHARKAEARELYGDHSSKILAMETALQVTMDNYKDKQKPIYWPNIPLRP